MWQLDLQFKNAELLKATGASVSITFFETGNRSSPNIVARAEAKLALDAEDKGSVPFTAFFYPELDVSKTSKNSMEAFGDYSLVLKQLKRADIYHDKSPFGHAPNAQKAYRYRQGILLEGPTPRRPIAWPDLSPRPRLSWLVE